MSGAIQTSEIGFTIGVSVVESASFLEKSFFGVGKPVIISYHCCITSNTTMITNNTTMHFTSLDDLDVIFFAVMFEILHSY